MMRVKRSAASLLLSCLAAFPVTAQSKIERSQSLFYINSKPVSTEEFVYLYRKNHQHKPEEFTPAKIEDYLGLFINYKLKVEEARSRGMDTTAAFRKEYQTYRDELLKPYMPDAGVIDSLVPLTYDRLREEVNASHILIRVSPDATPQDTLEAFERISALRKRVLAGEDFGTLAAEFSEEPGAETTKGNLGFFTAMQMVFPFEQAAYLTPVGQVSEPVRTRFGYHIVKVIARQPTRGEVEVSHIMIRTPDGGNAEETRNTIFDIHDRLQKGVKWEELCAEYSEDINTKDNGGRLRPFGVGAMASIPAFQDMAFSLQQPGEVSDPIQTQYGWHILRLESKIPLPSYEELKPSLTQRVSRDERVRISQAALRERMRKEFGYVERAGVKARLLDNADSIIGQRMVPGLHLVDSVLFSMSDHSYRVREFLEFLRAKVPGRQTGTSARQQLDALLTQFAEDAQMRVLEEKVKMESPGYRWLLNEYYEGILLFEIMEQEVWDRAMEDTVGQKRHFEAHAREYTAGERMVGKIYNSSRGSDLEKLKEMLLQKHDGIRGFITVNRIRQDSGAFEKADRAIFAKVSWSPGIYFVESNGITSLVEIEKILPPGLQTFEEARASVISDYQTFLEDSWIRELKRKFVVKVKKKAKKRAFAQLIDQKGEY